MNDSELKAVLEAQVDDMTSVSSSVIYEVIQREGAHELARSFGALW